MVFKFDELLYFLKNELEIMKKNLKLNVLCLMFIINVI